MDDWDAINRTSSQYGVAEPLVARFLSDVLLRRPRPLKVLDIGSGRTGRHAALCEMAGIEVVAIDISHLCRAHYHVDVHDFECEPETFDCILDIKTLCQDPNPPFEKIHRWLKPRGYFFTMIPGDEHKAHEWAFNIKTRPQYSYDYVRMASPEEIVALLPMFEITAMYQSIDPLRTGYLFTWVVEAQK